MDAIEFVTAALNMKYHQKKHLKSTTPPQKEKNNKTKQNMSAVYR